jgi:hypothetical protein
MSPITYRRTDKSLPSAEAATPSTMLDDEVQEQVRTEVVVGETLLTRYRCYYWPRCQKDPTDCLGRRRQLCRFVELVDEADEQAFIVEKQTAALKRKAAAMAKKRSAKKRKKENLIDGALLLGEVSTGQVVQATPRRPANAPPNLRQTSTPQDEVFQSDDILNEVHRTVPSAEAAYPSTMLDGEVQEQVRTEAVVEERPVTRDRCYYWPRCQKDPAYCLGRRRQLCRFVELVDEADEQAFIVEKQTANLKRKAADMAKLRSARKKIKRQKLSQNLIDGALLLGEGSTGQVVQATPRRPANAPSD